MGQTPPPPRPVLLSTRPGRRCRRTAATGGTPRVHPLVGPALLAALMLNPCHGAAFLDSTSGRSTDTHIAAALPWHSKEPRITDTGLGHVGPTSQLADSGILEQEGVGPTSRGSTALQSGSGPTGWRGSPWHNPMQHPRSLRQTKAAKVTGPCKGRPVVLNIYTEAQFGRRLWFPGRPVVMYLRRTIFLKKGLQFNNRFACTMLRSPGTARFNLTYDGWDMPILTINRTHNVWVQGVNFRQKVGTGAKRCLDTFPLSEGNENGDLVCPSIYVIFSFGVQINQGAVYGRIDLFRTIWASLDHLKVTGNPKYNANQPYWGDYDSKGFIRVGTTNAGTRPYRGASRVFITNCEVYGGWELITLFVGATGVVVSRNYLHDFMFVGIRCGADGASQFDCHHNIITNNLIVNPVAYSSSITDVNNAGIYTCIHFFNPGNYFSCNYMYNMRWCYYLDMTSSGVTIEGGMCNGSYSVTKINGGKYNTVRSLISVMSSKFLVTVSCITVEGGNCFRDSGNYWEAVRRSYWDVPDLNRRYPWMRKICNPITTKVNRQSCNPPGARGPDQTGYCSGYSYGNNFQTFWYYSGGKRDPYHYSWCDDFSTAFNHNQTYNVTLRPGFIGGGRAPNLRNFGLLPSARIYKLYPKFKSCPRQNVGPTRIRNGQVLRSYYTFWNINRPPTFLAVVNFDMSHCSNNSLSIPKNTFKVVDQSLNV